MINLHLGCNDKKIPNFINIDVLETSATDLVCDLKDIKNHFKNNSVDYIYACHVLEHFSRHEYVDILKNLFDILKHEGMIRISVPDFEALINYYIKTSDLNEIRGTLFGGQRNEFDYHKWVWDFKSLSSDLNNLGFVRVIKYDPFKTIHSSIRDWSKDFVPRHDAFGKQLTDEDWFKGTLVSLNIEAIKPKE